MEIDKKLLRIREYFRFESIKKITSLFKEGI